MTLLRAERGSAMAISLVLTSLALMMGLAVMRTVDTQQRSSRHTKDRESALNLAEGVLETQAFALSTAWSSENTSTFPQCTSGAAQTSKCPNKTSLGNTYPGGEFTGATWSTDVFDNSSTDGGNAMQNFYSDALAANAPRYDANDDGLMWVRSSATVQGRTRRIVALVKRQINPPERFPFATVTAGKFSVGNNGAQGNKVIVNLQSNGQSGPMQLRCTDKKQATCLDANVPTIQGGGGNKTDQITPAGLIYDKYAGGDALDDAALGRLRATAIADGTYVANCNTTTPDLNKGTVTFVEAGDCRFTGNGTYHSQAAPGILINVTGSIYFGGNSTFYGVLYAANRSNVTSDLITLKGNANLVGAAAADRLGGVQAGDSKDNILFDPNAVVNIRSYGTTGIVQNTWRELG